MMDDGVISLAKALVLNETIYQRKSHVFEVSKKLILQHEEAIITSDIDAFKPIEAIILQTYKDQCAKDIEINNAENVSSHLLRFLKSAKFL